MLDLGCGTGFHLPRFAATAATVIGVEPHADLVALAAPAYPRAAERRRAPRHRAGACRCRTRSIDVVHARWAYFFGPGCEPGLAELDRVVRRGGTAFVIDNDGSRSTFGAWFRRGYPHLDPPAVIERFWSTRGWTRTPIDMGWRFTSRADLEAVVRIEFKPAVAEGSSRTTTGSRSTTRSTSGRRRSDGRRFPACSGGYWVLQRPGSAGIPG